jgi:hypothetical protein
VAPSVSNPTPKLKDQGVSLCLGHRLWPLCQGRPYEQLRYRHNSPQDHLTTQTPPVSQSTDKQLGNT